MYNLIPDPDQHRRDVKQAINDRSHQRLGSYEAAKQFIMEVQDRFGEDYWLRFISPVTAVQEFDNYCELEGLV